jgi:hypothetical protein
MDIALLKSFLMWCTIIDAGLLILSFLVCACAGGLVYKVHSKWYPMPRETFNVAIYSLLGVFKVLFIVLNVVPYVALLIVA